MKKSILFLACASLLAGSAAAQDAASLFAQGKAAIEKYDKMSADFQLQLVKDKNAEDVTAKERAEIFMQGVDLLKQVLACDTIIEVDKKTGEPKIDKKTGKPKFKTKFSADVVSILNGHVGDYGPIGDAYFKAQDFQKAFDAYDLYAKGLQSDAFKDRVKSSDVGQVLFMQAYMAFNLKQYETAYDLSNKAEAMGFESTDISVVRNNSVALFVEQCVNEKAIDKANAFVDKCAAEKNTGFLQYLKGFIVEQDKGFEAAESFYHKAIELDPSNAMAQLRCGDCLYKKAQKIIDENLDASNKQLAPKLIPLFEEAIPYFEKAKELDDQCNAQAYLDDIQYKLELLKSAK